MDGLVNVQLALSNVDPDRRRSVEVFDTEADWDLFARIDVPPAELGSLAALTRLNLGNNDLNGSIPPALGGLANLESLWLEGNALAGSVPPELGGLTNLKDLRLQDNELKGSIPPEFGGLENLTSVVLARNGGIGRLGILAAWRNFCPTRTCAAFGRRVSGLAFRRPAAGRQLGAEAPPAAYLTQTVQSETIRPLAAGDAASECSWSPESGAGAGQLLSEWGEDARGGHSREAGPDTTGDQGG